MHQNEDLKLNNPKPPLKYRFQCDRHSDSGVMTKIKKKKRKKRKEFEKIECRDANLLAKFPFI